MKIQTFSKIGVKIYDCEKEQRITYIDRPKGSPRPDLYRCQLCWESDNRLLIGWADSIKIGEIRERASTNTQTPKPTSGPASLPDRFVEIVAQ